MIYDWVYHIIYIYTNIHIQTMTNQLFCLATHLRLAMLCLQLGKSCWVLVLDSFFRHEEMSQLRFAETLFSCHFSKRAIRLVTNCSMGGMVRPINMLGRWWWWWWWWWCLLCLQLLLYFQITVITYDYVALSWLSVLLADATALFFGFEQVFLEHLLGVQWCCEGVWNRFNIARLGFMEQIYNTSIF